ncbi:CocE/NonD family hydrolase [Geodermatophilus sabuli]|uniref:CocE/NonD family hydrolase n=1 Tax=Geodermatophilus sabuli TaxID=1564158 RepID=UPI000C7B7B6C
MRASTRPTRGPDPDADAAAVPPQPAWSPLWRRSDGGRGHPLPRLPRLRPRDRDAARGWASPTAGLTDLDSYDLIEWIAEQPWCDGNVGMVGISGTT